MCPHCGRDIRKTQILSQRDVVVLDSIVEGLNYKEISARTEFAIRTIKYRVLRAAHILEVPTGAGMKVKLAILWSNADYETLKARGIIA